MSKYDREPISRRNQLYILLVVSLFFISSCSPIGANTEATDQNPATLSGDKVDQVTVIGTHHFRQFSAMSDEVPGKFAREYTFDCSGSVSFNYGRILYSVDGGTTWLEPNTHNLAVDATTSLQITTFPDEVISSYGLTFSPPSD